MAKKRKFQTTKKSRKSGDNSPLYKTLLTSVELYTDGSASHTSRHGGWAYILTFPDGFEIIRSGYEEDTTNNAMELKAAIEGMRFFKTPKKITLYSDSAYMISALNEKWYKDWEKNGFTRRDGTPTPNKKLWQELIVLCSFHLVEPIKIKGHNGIKNNERCDKLAKQARKAGQIGLEPNEIRPVKRISKRPSRKLTLAAKEARGEIDWNAIKTKVERELKHRYEQRDKD